MTSLSKNKSKTEVLQDKYDQLKIIAELLGYSIEAGTEDKIYKDENRIIINGKQTIFNQIVSLAHEIGHVLTLDWCIANFGMRVLTGPSGYWPALESELRAWEAADKLLTKLGVYSSQYLKQKHICLRTYYRQTYKKKPIKQL